MSRKGARYTPALNHAAQAIAIGGLVVLAITVIAGSSSGRSAPVWLFVAILCWIGVVGGLFHLDERRKKRYLAEHRGAVCRRCDYPLGGMHTDPEGGVTCPECGARWTSELLRAEWQSLEPPSER